MISLGLLNIFGIIGMCVGINAFCKFNAEKRRLAKAVPAGAVVSVNTNDILDVGYVSTLASGLLSLFAFFFLFPGFLSGAYATRYFLRIQALILGFLTVWIFPTLVAFTYIFAHHTAKISVTIGTFALPDSLVQAAVASLGGSTIYKEVDYRESPLFSRSALPPLPCRPIRVCSRPRLSRPVAIAHARQAKSCIAFVYLIKLISLFADRVTRC